MRAKVLIALFLTTLNLVVYWPVTGHEFVFDDKLIMLSERRTLNGLSHENLVWSVTSTDYQLYTPLGRIAGLLGLHLFGTNPFGHHLVSLLIHGATCVLIFFVLSTLTGALWKSAAVAALCVVHPLRVEPVAWVSGQADLLAALFGMLALLAWILFLRRRGKFWAALAFVAFSLGMLSKIIVLTLPFVLLLLDYWPLGRAGASRCDGTAPDRKWHSGLTLVGEKAGLILTSLALTGLTFYLLHGSEVEYSLQGYPLSARVATSLISYATYVGKTLWPSGLTVIYPHAFSAFDPSELGVAILLIVAMSVAALAALRRFPFLIVGWLWFLGMLLPVIGLYQARKYPVADRYAYLPQIGFFMMAIWCVELSGKGSIRRRLSASTGILLLILIAVPVSRAQLHYWKNDLSLFGHAVAVAPDLVLARYNFADALADAGRRPEAILQLEEAVRLNPADPEVWNNLGIHYATQGRFSEAEQALRQAVRIKPDLATARYNLGLRLWRRGDHAGANKQYEALLKLDPKLAESLRKFYFNSP